MKNLDYENKMIDLDDKMTKELSVKETTRTKNYIVRSPKGNQYSVEPNKLDVFKQMFKVDEHWTII